MDCPRLTTTNSHVGESSVERSRPLYCSAASFPLHQPQDQCYSGVPPSTASPTTLTFEKSTTSSLKLTSGEFCLTATLLLAATESTLRLRRGAAEEIEAKVTRKNERKNRMAIVEVTRVMPGDNDS